MGSEESSFYLLPEGIPQATAHQSKITLILFYDQLQDQFDDECQWRKFRTTHHRLLRTPLQILFMSLQVKLITPTMSRNKSNERNWHCQVEGQCSIAQFLGQPGARLMNISFILKYFKSYWDVRKHMISKDTEHPKTTRYKKEINYRLTKSPRYRGFVLMLQHLRFFPLASSSSGWFFGVSSLSPFHHIGFLCLFLLMKLWHPQQIFYKSSELNQKK